MNAYLLTLMVMHKHLCSQLRQVPDNQEVFVEKDGDSSLVIEVVEIVSEENIYNQGVGYVIHPPKKFPH